MRVEPSVASPSLKTNSHELYAVWQADVEVHVYGTEVTTPYTGSSQSNNGYTVKYYVAGQEVASLPTGVTFTPSVTAATGTNVGDYYGTAGGTLTIMAGPCSVESEEQLVGIAKAVKASGATILRGGAFKPRTSPYSFQGLGETALRYLVTAKQETGLPIITELMEINQIPLFKDVDIIQIGARNMQNFDLLKAVGELDKPILLKRGMCATYEELLMSAEYIMSRGNHNVILCERGIRTFETYTRNTLDLTCVPVLRKLTHLPIIIDPSHATGKYFLVPPMALAAVAAGADGLEIEVHNDPPHAWSDGGQSLRPEKFDELAGMLSTMHEFVRSQPKGSWE